MRFGLLGTGHWARVVHGAALAAHPDVEFAGVWGRNPEKAAALADELGVLAFTEVDELLAEVDAVAVALPPGIQAELATRAAQAGKHLLLDKPLALTVEDADTVVRAVEASGVSSVVFFTNRFRPHIVEVLDQAIATGGWLGGRSTLFGSIYSEGSPYAESAWRKIHGGLWDIGPHALSLFIPVLGKVTSVSAMEGPRQTFYVTLRHDGGAVSTMELTLASAEPAVKFENLFHGESGWLTIGGFESTPVDAYQRAVSELLASVPGGGHPLDVHFGREVVAILAAAEESARTGRHIEVGP
ncbi:putative dehydrogenase [Allocatelliglobosispora scoriae]|uniref:Putative dehydrogenase n=1 Tax=Allocatelliglobosispora scoriae TaxID=643052 RepID=A0A841BUP4_9ACTN|nr:Gfo/Idh/MocA family oxidoreductase [Allocatelliglobosispora scoriae]MBB5872837.1 putative dehydrogenase [Allocatelliglobosispora scoriae]